MGGWNYEYFGGLDSNQFLSSTEIFMLGKWKLVGSLPLGVQGVRGATLDNSVFMMGKSFK